MASNNNFKDSGTLWTSEEDRNLYELYNVDLLNIIEISNKLYRSPGTIISRLIKHNYIPNRTSARGYLIYRNSDLYKSIVSNAEERKKNNKKETSVIKKESNVKKKDITNDNLFISINKSDYIDLQNDIDEMKNEIIDLKVCIKEMSEMIKAIYEFE